MLSLALILDSLTPMLWFFALSQFCLALGRAWFKCHEIAQDAFLHVPVSGSGAFQVNELAIVGPAQFGKQCVLNWIGLVKFAYISQVRHVKTTTKFCREL